MFGCEKKGQNPMDLRMDLCVYESEDHDHGVSPGPTTNLLSDTL
jgi:hypothetical protein